MKFITFAKYLPAGRYWKCVNVMLQSSLRKFGDYVRLMWRTFSRPDRWKEFFKCYVDEVYKLGVNSIPIVIIISIFIGAVIAIQMQLNIMSPLLPKYTVGVATREIILLEFSSTIMALILAGKVGSNITSEIGAMRVTEQIDALDIMGINSANYIILPKITGMITFMPILVVFSMAMGIFGAYAIAVLADVIPVSVLTYGIQAFFNEFYIWYALFKSLFFAFIISSIAAYYGYTVKGGSLQVGTASTNAVVVSSVTILVVDVIITQIMMG